MHDTDAPDISPEEAERTLEAFARYEEAHQKFLRECKAIDTSGLLEAYQRGYARWRERRRGWGTAT